MMRKHILIAGLMSATVLCGIVPAGAAPPEHSSHRWNQNDRANRVPPQRAQRATERHVTPRASMREPARTQRVERQRLETRAQMAGQRQAERQADRQHRRDWRQDNRDERREWHRNDRDDRRDWRRDVRDDRRDDRRDWRQDRGDDRRDWRENRREDRRDWRNDARYRDHDRHVRPAPRYNWNRDWRRNQRYDWQHYRDRYRDRYRHRYYAPRGWSYGYRRFSIGISIWSGLYSNRYWINDPWYYRLPPVYGSLRWVRYYDDALLVDIRTGYVVDVIYDFFW